MILLKDLCNRQERKKAWIQQKVEKQAKKMLESELRKTNMKCNVERSRGQKDRGDKYQTLLSKDADALAFHAKHAGKKNRGSKCVKMMLAIKHKTCQAQHRLTDRESHSQQAIRSILGSTLPLAENIAEVTTEYELHGVANHTDGISDVERLD